MFSPFKQQTAWWCGPAAVKWFLSYYGITATQPHLANLLDTTDEKGTDPHRIHAILREHYELPVESGHGLGLTRVSLPMIVNWFDGEGHYSVITELQLKEGEGLVTMFDPWPGATRTKDWRDFTDNWYSERYGHHWGLYMPR